MEEDQNLSNRKLQLEINELEKSWWKKPQYIAAFSPLLIALISLFALILSGFFDKRISKLNIQIDELSIKRDSIKNEVAKLHDSLEIKHGLISQLNDDIVAISSDLNGKMKDRILQKTLKFENDLKDKTKDKNASWVFDSFQTLYYQVFKLDRIQFMTTLEHSETFSEFLSKNKIKCIFFKNALVDDPSLLNDVNLYRNKSPFSIFRDFVAKVQKEGNYSGNIMMTIYFYKNKEVKKRMDCEIEIFYKSNEIKMYESGKWYLDSMYSEVRNLIK